MLAQTVFLKHTESPGKCLSVIDDTAFSHNPLLCEETGSQQHSASQSITFVEHSWDVSRF